MEKGIFFTDFTTKFHPEVVNKLKKAKAGDIIYLKSYNIKDQILHIQAISIFKDDKLIKKTIGGRDGTARNVDWVIKKVSTIKPFKIPSARKYNTTFYEENCVENILKVMKCLNEK